MKILEHPVYIANSINDKTVMSLNTKSRFFVNRQALVKHVYWKFHVAEARSTRQKNLSPVFSYVNLQTFNRLDSSVGRVSAFRAGAHGLESKLHQPEV